MPQKQLNTAWLRPSDQKMDPTQSGDSQTPTNYPWTSEGSSSCVSHPEGFRSPRQRWTAPFPRRKRKWVRVLAMHTSFRAGTHTGASQRAASRVSPAASHEDRRGRHTHSRLSATGLPRLSSYSGHAGVRQDLSGHSRKCEKQHADKETEARGGTRTRKNPVSRVWKPKAQRVWELSARCKGIQST